MIDAKIHRIKLGVNDLNFEMMEIGKLELSGTTMISLLNAGFYRGNDCYLLSRHTAATLCKYGMQDDHINELRIVLGKLGIKLSGE